MNVNINQRMRVQVTCPHCGSSIECYGSGSPGEISCSICQHKVFLAFNSDHEQGLLRDCPVCERKDFYKQKDFNRKIGVIFFAVAAILSIWTYGLSLVVLYLVDLFLFGKIGNVAICYKCDTNFRNVANLSEIGPFNHEYHDRIKYSDHDFQGKTEHKA